jgi:hypothetical protein
VRFVEHEERAVAVLDFDNLGERRPVAIHREDALGDDKDAGVGVVFARPLEVALELAEVVVREDADAAPRAARRR